MMGKKNRGFLPKSLPQRRSEDIRRSKACRTSQSSVPAAFENSETPSVRFRALMGGVGDEPAQLVITGT
jgi:hypothetical protein